MTDIPTEKRPSTLPPIRIAHIFVVKLAAIAATVPTTIQQNALHSEKGTTVKQVKKKDFPTAYFALTSTSSFSSHLNWGNVSDFSGFLIFEPLTRIID